MYPRVISDSNNFAKRFNSLALPDLMKGNFLGRCSHSFATAHGKPYSLKESLLGKTIAQIALAGKVLNSLRHRINTVLNEQAK